jgi:hypothetical protein
MTSRSKGRGGVYDFVTIVKKYDGGVSRIVKLTPIMGDPEISAKSPIHSVTIQKHHFKGYPYVIHSYVVIV